MIIMRLPSLGLEMPLHEPRERCVTRLGLCGVGIETSAGASAAAVMEKGKSSASLGGPFPKFLLLLKWFSNWDGRFAALWAVLPPASSVILFITLVPNLVPFNQPFSSH